MDLGTDKRALSMSVYVFLGWHLFPSLGTFSPNPFS